LSTRRTCARRTCCRYNHNQRVSASYVTGSHAFKVGMTTIFGLHDVYRSLTKRNVAYTFRNLVPISLSQYTSPGILPSRLRDLGIYAQDQWTVHQLTFNLGARFDWFYARTLEQDLPPTRFVGARHWPAVENVPNWKDVNPRVSILAVPGASDISGQPRFFATRRQAFPSVFFVRVP